MGYSFKKINKNERKSLVGSTIQIRGPLLQTLERQELHTLGGSQWGRKQGKGGGRPLPFLPCRLQRLGVGEVGVQICISGLWGVLIIIFMFLSIHLSFILIFVVFMVCF